MQTTTQQKMSSDTSKRYALRGVSASKEDVHNAIKNIGNPNYNSLMDSINQAKAEQAAFLLKEILSSATILPVEKSWDKLFPCSWNSINREDIKNGVIIQPKQ